LWVSEILLLKKSIYETISIIKHPYHNLIKQFVDENKILPYRFFGEYAAIIFEKNC